MMALRSIRNRAISDIFRRTNGYHVFLFLLDDTVKPIVFFDLTRFSPIKKINRDVPMSALNMRRWKFYILKKRYFCFQSDCRKGPKTAVKDI